jgi:hypothetical protein
MSSLGSDKEKLTYQYLITEYKFPKNVGCFQKFIQTHLDEI